MELGDMMFTSNPHAFCLASIYFSILQRQKKNFFPVFLTPAMKSIQFLGFPPSYPKCPARFSPVCQATPPSSQWPLIKIQASVDSDLSAFSFGPSPFWSKEQLRVHWSHSHPDVIRNCGFHLRWPSAHSFLFLEPKGLLWIFQLMRYGHKLFEKIYWHFLLSELQVGAQHFYFEWLHPLSDPEGISDPPCCNLEHWHVHKRTADLQHTSVLFFFFLNPPWQSLYNPSLK